MIAASIRIYALVARGHRLRRDRHRRKQRAVHLGSWRLVCAMSARAGATFISFNRARTYGVRPGEDATGVKSGFWSLPTRMPE